MLNPLFLLNSFFFVIKSDKQIEENRIKNNVSFSNKNKIENTSLFKLY